MCRGVAPRTPSLNCRIASLRRSGILVIIRRCHKSSLQAGSPTCLPAVFAIELMFQWPKNSNLAGLPAAYFVQQIADYKSGARKTSVPKRGPVALMISLSKDITDAEVEAAAAYFSALKPKSNIRAVETDAVPKTFVAGWFLAASKTGEKEPIGQRIIEVPEDLEQFENRDPRSQFIAYVPIGSIAKGAALVSTGGAGKTLQCAICHGQDLKGLGGTPSIIGRSPSYVVRQLYDIQNGARAGTAAQLMKATVANLTVEDMVSIAAYLASRAP